MQRTPDTHISMRWTHPLSNTTFVVTFEYAFAFINFFFVFVSKETTFAFSILKISKRTKKKNDNIVFPSNISPIRFQHCHKNANNRDKERRNCVSRWITKLLRVTSYISTYDSFLPFIHKFPFSFIRMHSTVKCGRCQLNSIDSDAR